MVRHGSARYAVASDSGTAAAAWPTAAVRKRPLAAALGAVALLGAVRAVEVLAGLHRLGALVASSLFALAAAVWLARALLAAPFGGSPATTRRAFIVGGGVVAVQALAHLLQVGALAAAGQQPLLVVGAVNPATKATGAGQVGIYLLFGVLIAAIGQELLFRGVLLRTLARRLSFWPANAVQAVAFGGWHLAWPLAVATTGAVAPVSLSVYAVGTVAVTGLVGGVYAVLARATGTLWTAVLAHVLHNLSAVVLHVRTPNGADHGAVLSPALVVGYVALAWAARVRWGDSSLRNGRF